VAIPRHRRDVDVYTGLDDLLLHERARVVLVDHLEDLAGHRQKLGAELLVLGRRGARRARALLGHLLQALREAAVDRLLPFVDVHLAVVRRVEDLERALEALRLEQELEVRLAARPQERHDGLVRLDGLDDFKFCQGPAAVDVDEVEALAGGVEELVAEFFDLLGRPRGLELALGRAVRELVRERGLDGLLPARNADR